MSDTRDTRDELKITDADDVRRTDRMDAASTGSTSADTADDNRSVLDDVAHPFDQTNGILDDYDETHPGNVTGESPSEFAASAGPAGADAPRPGTDAPKTDTPRTDAARSGADDAYRDDDTPPAPPFIPSAGR